MTLYKEALGGAMTIGEVLRKINLMVASRP